MERSKPAWLLFSAALVSGGMAAISGLAFAFGSSFTTLDTTFGNSGYTVTDLGSDKDHGIDLALGSDGSIYSLASTTDSGGAVTNVVTHYNGSTGALDTSFGVGGKRSLSDSSVPFASGDHGGVLLAVDDVNRQFYLAGFIFGTSNKLVVARFNFDGTLDTSYGSNHDGLSDPVPVKDSVTYTGKLVLDSKLNLYFEGADLNQDASFNVTDSNGSFLARYTKSGTLDPTFNAAGPTKGYLSFKYGACDQTSNNFTIGASGAIYIPGAVFSSCGGAGVPAVAKILLTGQLDSSFGTAGIASFPSLVTDSGDTGLAAQEQSNGEVAFAFGNGPSYHAVVLKSNGSQDAAVSEVNATYTPSDTKFNQNGGSVIQSTGKLVFSGQYQTSTSKFDLALTRLDGDPAFGSAQSGGSSSSSSSGGSSSSSSSSGSSSSSSSGSSSSSSSSSGGHSSSSGSSSGGSNSSSSSSGGGTSSSSSSGTTTGGGGGGGGAFGVPALLGLAAAAALRRRKRG